MLDSTREELSFFKPVRVISRIVRWAEKRRTIHEMRRSLRRKIGQMADEK